MSPAQVSPNHAAQAPDSSRTVMWEAKAIADRDEDLLAFALERAHPDAQVYRSADARVVVIDPTGAGLPEAPADVVARTPHVWHFQRIERTKLR